MYREQRRLVFKKFHLVIVLAIISVTYMLSYNHIFYRNDPPLHLCINKYAEEIKSVCTQIGLNSERVSTFPLDQQNFNLTENETEATTTEPQGQTALLEYSYPTDDNDENEADMSPSRNAHDVLERGKENISVLYNLTNERPSPTVSTVTTKSLSLQESNKTDINPWKVCPEPGKGPESTFLSALVDGRLGNVVWSYLSVVVAAKIHNLRPVLTSSAIDFLHLYVFNETYLRVPTVEWLDETCQMNGWLLDAYNGNESKVLYSREIFFEELENPPKAGFAMMKYSYFITNTEELIPHWHELKNELILKDELKRGAEMELQRLTKIYARRSMIVDVERIEYVGIHVRRTDYIHHMSAVHPGSKVAGPNFFQNAMKWLIKKLQKPLIFAIVSDDGFWTEQNIVKDRLDSFLAGDGNLDNPGLDLALLAACNHTIFPYGTFGLTGAFLASQPGGYTITFDPQNGTITKEMEFASNLPGWRIMDDDGNINYRDNHISYAYYLHPPIRN